MIRGRARTRRSGEGDAERSSGLRRSVLRAHGATEGEVAELLEYNERRFESIHPDDLPDLPLEDEQFVKTWRGYSDRIESGRQILDVLREDLVQLRFPVAEGMSRNPVYSAAVRRGDLPPGGMLAGGTELDRPADLELQIRSTPAGDLPILVTGCREDFCRLLRALIHENEPVPIRDAVGATIVSGYNNWGRVRDHRRRWEAAGDGDEPRGSWGEEFRRLRERKELYQDRFVVASPGLYSGVPATAMSLEPVRWRELSVRLRIAHESAHYVTRRLLGAMGNFLHDELIADYVGIVTVCGEFRSGWFLRFMGLEDHPRFRRSGRLSTYRGEPELSEGAFRILRSLMTSAATNLGAAGGWWNTPFQGTEDEARRLAVLAGLTLEEISSEDGTRRLEHAL